MCTLPLDSVVGTLCTLCTPLSYFSLENAPFPFINITASFMPLSPVSFSSMISVFQFFESAYMEYILRRSLPKSAASSPPVPALISSITFFSSRGSLGIRSIFSCSSSLFISSSRSDISSFARSFISSSPPAPARSSFASKSSCLCFLNELYVLTIGSISLISFMYFCQSG